MIVPSTLAAASRSWRRKQASWERRSPAAFARDVMNSRGRAAAISELQDADETVLEIDGTIDPGTVRQLEDRIWDHFDARHHYLRHLAPDQFGGFTDGVMRKHHSDPLALGPALAGSPDAQRQDVHAAEGAVQRSRTDGPRPGAARRGRP